MHIPQLLALAASAAVITLAGSALAAKPPPQFLRQAMEGDNSEIALGRLAESRASSPGVRNFGRTLEQDHSQARDKARQVAQQLGVQPTDAMMPEARTEQHKLEKLSGAAFDREFVRYMVHDHQKDIQDFDDQAHGHGPTASLAQQTLPTLHKHLEMAQQLER